MPPATPAAILPDAPNSDLYNLARRYLGFHGTPLPASVLYPNEPAGTHHSFEVFNPEAPSLYRVSATLRYVGRHALWYVADGLSVDEQQLQQTAQQFDDEVYPQDMKTFAPNEKLPSPITIVISKLQGLSGYFSSVDTLPRGVYPDSNQRVAIFMSTGVGTDSYMGTLAHELQHVLHWTEDPSEETWVNEGLSELAPHLLRLPALPYSAYLQDPDVSVTNWAENVNDTLPNYAAASLFMSYLAQRTGLANLHDLVAQPADGVKGVQAYLNQVAPGLTFDQIFGDWLVANLVGATQGPYAYASPPGTVSVTQVARGPASGTVQVPQYGGWYMRIEPDSTPLTVHFDGQQAAPVLPVPPHSGQYCWWGNRGDSIDSMLTRTLDLTGVRKATLRFWEWYDIEKDFDHGYVSVSTDGGSTWTALAGRQTTASDPIDTAYGPSYTGQSQGWVPEEVDLSKYAGSRILLRFELVNDESVNGTGWCIDDIQVPEIGFFDGAESGNDGWQTDGFVRLSSAGIQQHFLLRLVQGTGNFAKVTSVLLDARNNATFVVDKPATLVVGAMASKTSQPAAFTYTISH